MYYKEMTSPEIIFRLIFCLISNNSTMAQCTCEKGLKSYHFLRHIIFGFKILKNGVQFGLKNTTLY